MTWRSTGVAAATIADGALREVVLDGRSVALARSGTEVFAVDGVCPHLGGALAEGTLSGRRLTCPLHEATFDVTNGAVVTDPFGLVPPEGGVEPVRSYPTREQDGMVEVDLPDAVPP